MGLYQTTKPQEHLQRDTKMAEGRSSDAIVCHCDDSKDPFARDWRHSNTWRCEFNLSALSSSIKCIACYIVTNSYMYNGRDGYS